MSMAMEYVSLACTNSLRCVDCIDENYQLQCQVIAC